MTRDFLFWKAGKIKIAECHCRFSWRWRYYEKSSCSVRAMLSLYENSDLHLVNFTGIFLYRKSVPGVTGPIDTLPEFFDLKLFLNEELLILINKMVCFLDMPSVSWAHIDATSSLFWNVDWLLFVDVSGQTACRPHIQGSCLKMGQDGRLDQYAVLKRR
jgi:hypothetical protein